MQRLGARSILFVGRRPTSLPVTLLWADARARARSTYSNNSRKRSRPSDAYDGPPRSTRSTFESWLDAPSNNNSKPKKLFTFDSNPFERPVRSYERRNWGRGESSDESSGTGIVVDSETRTLCDLRQPHTWYDARRMTRTIHLHVGPTNSGKTHSAVQALKAAPSGVYCGPLRLLAWELYERLNDGGTPCNLLTGQEREEVEGAGHVSCTVEMVDVTHSCDVAVLDEIQMIGDPDRGWAWTRILLGMCAPVIHACGDPSAVPLVTSLLKLTGDELIIHEYKRLSPLQVASKPLPSLSAVQRGDCVVAFSRRDLFKAKHQIESATGLRCGVIYGALPPQIRRDMAKRFNQHTTTGGNSAVATTAPSDSSASSSPGAPSVPMEPVDVLVATDAVGMGLNLAIRRMVFSALDKFDGTCRRPLNISEMKQIAGRAGRFGSSFPVGVVSGVKKTHLPQLRDAIASPTPPLRSAGILPQLEQLEQFAAALVSNALEAQEEAGNERSEEDEEAELIEGESDAVGGFRRRDDQQAELGLSAGVIVHNNSSTANRRQTPITYSGVYDAQGNYHELPQRARPALTLAQSQPAALGTEASLGIQPSVAADARCSADDLAAFYEDTGALADDSTSSMRTSFTDSCGPSCHRLLASLPKQAFPSKRQQFVHMSTAAKSVAAPVQLNSYGFRAASETESSNSYFVSGSSDNSSTYLEDDDVNAMLLGGTQHHAQLFSTSSLRLDCSFETATVDGDGSQEKSHEGNISVNGTAAAAGSELDDSDDAIDDDDDGEDSDDFNLCNAADDDDDDDDEQRMIDGRLRSRAGMRTRQMADDALLTLPFSAIFQSFLDYAQVNRGLYHLCDCRDLIAIARKLDSVEGLPFRVRYAWCMAPVDVEDALIVTALKRYARKFVEKGRVKVGLRVPAMPPHNPGELAELESAHAVFDLYLWLARRYPTEFIQVSEAQQAAGATQRLIQEGLQAMGDDAIAQSRAGKRKAAAQRKALAVSAAATPDLAPDLATDEEDSDDSLRRLSAKRGSQYLRSMVVDEEEEDDDPEVYLSDADNDDIGTPGQLFDVYPSATRPANAHELSSRAAKQRAKQKRLDKKAARRLSRAAQKEAAKLVQRAFASGGLPSLKALQREPRWQEVIEASSSSSAAAFMRPPHVMARNERMRVLSDRRAAERGWAPSRFGGGGKKRDRDHELDAAAAAAAAARAAILSADLRDAFAFYPRQ